MVKNLVVGIVSVLLGAIFIFSAYAKLFPIEIFEFSFIEIKLANWTTAPFFARFFIALEFFIGLLLLLNFKGGNRHLAKFTIYLLLLLTVYLIAIIFAQGNTSNCGCFGTYIKMTPLESIIKNLVLLSLTALLFLVPTKQNFSSLKIVVLSSAIASITAPFIINPIATNPPPSETKINYTLNLNALYIDGRTDRPKVNLRKDKRIIAFLSLTCPHCKIGAQKLNIIHNHHPELPIYYILNGEQSDLKNFLEESKTTSINYSFMTLKEGFLANSGLNLPAILWVNNSRVEHKTKYTQLDESDLIKWFNNN